MSRTPTQAEALDANDLLPGHNWTTGRVEEGGDDHLVLIPGDAEPQVVVRIARRPDVAAELPRRMDFLTAIAPHLPLTLPVPVTELRQMSRTGARAVGQKYVPGAQHAPGGGSPEALRAVLDVLENVPTSVWEGLVDPPFEGQPHWNEQERELVLQALPDEARSDAAVVWDALTAMDGEAVGLVHGDLAGDNMRWIGERVAGLLDWDHASAWDPAVNLAHLALWHGAETIDAVAPNGHFAARSGVWVGHLSLVRVHDAARRQAAGGTVRRWSRLLRKTLPRLEMASTAAGRL